MSKEETDKQFWHHKWSERSGGPNPFTQSVMQHIRKGERKALLDLGCGDGRDTVFFVQHGFDVTAVDFSATGIEKLKSVHPDMNAIQADIRTLKLPDDSFDVIYAHLSLHYFDDETTRKVFDAIHAMLKPGGYFFVKCKSVDDPLYGEGKKVGEDMYIDGHLRHFFSKAYLREMLHKFGIASLQSTKGTYDDKTSAFVEAIAKKGNR